MTTNPPTDDELEEIFKTGSGDLEVTWRDGLRAVFAAGRAENQAAKTSDDETALINEVRELFDEGWCICRRSGLGDRVLAALDTKAENQMSRDQLADSIADALVAAGRVSVAPTPGANLVELAKSVGAKPQEGVYDNGHFIPREMAGLPPRPVETTTATTECKKSHSGSHVFGGYLDPCTFCGEHNPDPRNPVSAGIPIPDPDPAGEYPDGWHPVEPLASSIGISTNPTDAGLTAAFRSAGPKMPAGVPLPPQVLAGLRAVAALTGTQETGDHVETFTAVDVVNYLLAGMERNNAYEYNGRSIYDGLTRDHIDETIRNFASRPTQPQTPEQTGGN